ncbi:hypothetical protein CK203_042124 [Vitis vinifera]|uniref:Uncharacterized protein n=1 Tax=Vitis vinifera TaxID=29760 RepID=A0A438HPY8_VITVI|nr:hypothetical protein CK203_042124 [Vitis vinifera]
MFHGFGYECRMREKRKEKRHQKDKKDKDRREGKEKKDEERSKEKNREKKDRKEKKKDKKERNRDREKNRTSDEKRIEGKPASYNGEKPHPNNLPGVEISNSKIVQELGRRLGDKDKIVGSPMVQKVTLTDKGRPELEGSMVESNIGNSAEKKRKSKDKMTLERPMDKEIRLRQEILKMQLPITLANGQGNKVQARVSENATVHNYGWMDQRRVAQSNIGTGLRKKGSLKTKMMLERPMDKETKLTARGPENATVHNSPWMDQRRTGQSIIGNWAEGKKIEGMQVEKKDVEKQVKVKENNEHNGSHSRGDKKKDKDREKEK